MNTYELEQENARLQNELADIETKIADYEYELRPLIFPDLVAADIVGIQPMMAPVNNTWAINYTYSPPTKDPGVNTTL
jgi:hypothetical protein